MITILSILLIVALAVAALGWSRKPKPDTAAEARHQAELKALVEKHAAAVQEMSSKYNDEFNAKFQQMAAANADTVKQLNDTHSAQLQGMQAQHEKDKKAQIVVVTQAAKKEAEASLAGWIKENEKRIREDAAARSKSVRQGHMTEQLAPYLPEFTWNPKDARFLGSPLDMLIFDGLDEGELREIVMLEIKKGSSTLSKRERMVRDAVNDGRVRYQELRFKA